MERCGGMWCLREEEEGLEGKRREVKERQIRWEVNWKAHHYEPSQDEAGRGQLTEHQQT